MERSRTSDLPSSDGEGPMVMKKRNLAPLLCLAALAACSDPEEGPGVLPENMAEENLPAVDTVQEYQFDIDVNTVDVGDDAVAVR